MAGVFSPRAFSRTVLNDFSGCGSHADERKIEEKEEGEGVSKENETDTFISVDIELRRVAINCSVYEYGGWEGRRRRRGAEIHFPIFILVKFFFFFLQVALCSGAES